MSEKKLKYEFSESEVNFVLNALNKVQLSGVQTAQGLVAIANKLQNPLNAKDLEKEQLEALKEPKKKK
jgi:hypothetical protein